MRRLAALLALLSAGLVAPRASAQAIGTALSGPSTADGSAAYYNPAAMGAARGSSLELDAGLSVIDLGYDPADGSAGSSQTPVGPLLTLGGFSDLDTRDWRVGFTVGVSRASGGSWSRDDGAAAITRYYLVNGQFFHIQGSVGGSFSPAPWITIGLGLNLAYASLGSDLDKDFGAQLNQTAGSTELDAPFPYAEPSLAAPVTVSGSGFGAGFLGGVHVRPIDELALSFSIHSPVWVLGAGTLSVEYPQALRDFVANTLPSAELPDLNGNIDLNLDIPLIFFFGVSARPHPMVELAAYYQFEHTSSQPNFNLDVSEATSEAITDQSKPQAYLDRHRVLVRGGVYPVEELLLAIHGAYQSNTVPDETAAPNNLDFHRVEVGANARWRIVPELSLLLSYSHIFLIDRDVTTSLHRPVTQPSLAAFNHPSPTGRYHGSANTVRLGLALHL